MSASIWNPGPVPASILMDGGTFTGLVNFKVGDPIASAATLDLSTATGNTVHISGTTATSALTMNAGQWMRVIADAAWPLTYHATTNRLNTGASTTLAAGDTVDYFYDGTTVFGVVNATAADPTLVHTSDIGVSVQAYDADIPTVAASQGEMGAGTEAALRSMSPLRVAQAIAALAGVTLTRTTFTASGNLTFPAGVTQAWVTGQGCGGGGGGTTAGGDGGTTTFGPNGGAVVLTLAGGTGGSAASGTTGGAGGAGGGSGLTKGRSGRAGQYKATIGGGVNPAAYCVAVGGRGGSGEVGELGSGGNGGDGGNTGGGVSSAAAGGGGGAGEQCFSFPVTVTAAQWDVIIGSAGTAGTADGGTAPQVGQAGFFIVEYLS